MFLFLINNMRKLTKKEKQITKVGYYWWIFKMDSFIKWIKPYVNDAYGCPTAHTFHSNNVYDKYGHTTYNHSSNYYNGHYYDKKY